MTQPQIPGLPDVTADAAIEVLRGQLEAQPWYKRFSNSVTTGLGVLALIIALLVANGVELSDQVTGYIASGIGILTLLGVIKTPNGVTPRGVAKVEAAAQEAQARSL